MSATLTPELARAMAASTLSHLGREYPHHQSHLLNGPGDARTPAALHPAFHGSLDWHSCVHGWWQVMRLARLFPDLPTAHEARTRAGAVLTPDALAGEIAYFERPGTAGFERPYGWGWLLALHDELATAGGAPAAAVAPLARLIAARLGDYLGRLTYPVRHGVHSNTAFALLLAHRWAVAHDPALAALVARRAAMWFADDRPAPWLEPSGEDFLSPTLTVAALMAQVMPKDDFAPWFARYRGDDADFAALRTPARVSDRSDPRIAHLDGLNFSRAWCWRLVDPGERTVADAHLSASLPYLRTDYMGEHWLASFALLALTG